MYCTNLYNTVLESLCKGKRIILNELLRGAEKSSGAVNKSSAPAPGGPKKTGSDYRTLNLTMTSKADKSILKKKKLDLIDTNFYY